MFTIFKVEEALDEQNFNKEKEEHEEIKDLSFDEPYDDFDSECSDELGFFRKWKRSGVTSGVSVSADEGLLKWATCLLDVFLHKEQAFLCLLLCAMKWCKHRTLVGDKFHVLSHACLF